MVYAYLFYNNLQQCNAILTYVDTPSSAIIITAKKHVFCFIKKSLS